MATRPTSRKPYDANLGKSTMTKKFVTRKDLSSRCAERTLYFARIAAAVVSMSQPYSNRIVVQVILHSLLSSADDSLKRDLDESFRKAVRSLFKKKNAEPNGPANGSQPIRLETNRTSSAAGTRRRP